MMIIENNNFVYQTEKGQKIIIAPEMRITNYTEHIPTGIYENEIEIEFFKCITNGEIVKNKFIIKASQFADIKEFVSVCSKNGCLITPNYVNYVFIFLTNNLRSMIQSNSNILYKHNVLGYHKYKEITHFFWDKTKIDGTNISCYAKPQVSFVQGNEQEYFRN